MRVNPSVSQQVQSSQSEAAKKSEGAAKTARAEQLATLKKNQAAGSTDSAKTEISAKGKEFAAAHAVAKSAPDMREDRIAALKAKIAEGKYELDANKIADKMVSEHMSF